MAVSDTLTEKLGPLPVWAWGGIIGGTILVGGAVYRAVRPPAPLPDSEETGPATDEPVGVDLAGSSLVTYPGAGVIVGGGGFSLPDTAPEPETNWEWGQRVGNELIQSRARGWSPVLVASALDRYLRELELDDNEYAVIEHVLATYGQPPDPVAPPRFRPPAPVQPPPPPNPDPNVPAPTRPQMAPVNPRPGPTRVRPFVDVGGGRPTGNIIPR